MDAKPIGFAKLLVLGFPTLLVLQNQNCNRPVTDYSDLPYSMNNSEKEGNTSALDPPADFGPQNATPFERWRKKAWRAAGFGLSDDERLETMTRSCEKQRDYLMTYSA